MFLCYLGCARIFAALPVGSMESLKRKYLMMQGSFRSIRNPRIMAITAINKIFYNWWELFLRFASTFTAFIKYGKSILACYRTFFPPCSGVSVCAACGSSIIESLDAFISSFNYDFKQAWRPLAYLD